MSVNKLTNKYQHVNTEMCGVDLKLVSVCCRLSKNYNNLFANNLDAMGFRHWLMLQGM